MALLRDLRTQVGPSFRALALRTGLAKSTIEGWLTKGIIPTEIDGLKAVCDAILERAGRVRGEGLTPGVVDELRQIDWTAAHLAVQRARAPGRSERAQIGPARKALAIADSARLVAAAADRPRALSTFTAKHLGVHPAIRGASWRGAQSAFVLPNYFDRPHDRLLRERLHRVSAGASIELVVLRGASCTGKTRTAYEAVRSCLADWQLVHPKTGASLLSLLSVEPIGPRLVVWLDDVHNLLMGLDGEEVAAGLRRYLERPGPGVVVATIWPEHYERFASGRAHAQADALLRLAEPISIPDSFDDEELAAVRERMRTDASLTTALRSTRGSGAICQTLAAGPDLLDRWLHAPDPYGKALITAAIDARRLGVQSPIPNAALRDAIPGYLTAEQRAQAPSDWEDAAWAYATQSIRRVTAALKAVPRPDDVGPLPGVVDVADYLEERGRVARETALPPESLWEALSIHISDGHDLYQLASSAERQRYLRLAAALYERAVQAGEARAMHSLAGLLRQAGKEADAIQWLRRGADLGSTIAIQDLESSLAKQGDTHTTLELWRGPAEAGDTFAIGRLARRLERVGEFDEALSWWRRGSERGDMHCLRSLAAMPDEPRSTRRGRTDMETACLPWRRHCAVGADRTTSRARARR